MKLWYHGTSQSNKKSGWNISATHLRPSQGGGLVAMGRAWFNLTGGFDEGMHGWGGENLAPWVQKDVGKKHVKTTWINSSSRKLFDAESLQWFMSLPLDKNSPFIVFQFSTHLTMVKIDTSMLWYFDG